MNMITPAANIAKRLGNRRISGLSGAETMGGDTYQGVVEVENDSTIELGWLSEATTFADAYLARLQDPTFTDPLAGLPGTGDAAAHATLYEAFRRVFPTMDVGRLDADDPLRPYLDREFWAPLLRRHGDLIPDPTMLTLLRPDCRRPHGAGNAMLVPRLKFLCIELARNREGCNDRKALVASVQQQQQQAEEQQESKTDLGPVASKQLVICRTRKYSAIGVVSAHSAPAQEEEEEEDGDGDVEEAVEALMAERGIGTDASEEVRAVVRAELRRQLHGYRQAQLANRAGVAEQARESRPPSAYRRAEGEPAVLGRNHVVALRSERGRGGLCVLDGMVSDETLAAARAEAERMKASGLLQATPQKAAGTRFDSVRWLEEAEVEGEGYPVLAGLVRMMKGLASEVEEEGDEGEEGGDALLIPRLLVPKHCMLAVYEGEGALYVPHRDNVPRAVLERSEAEGEMGNDREVTAILYLNPPDWDAQRDGGCLRCYVGAEPDDESGETATEVVDIAPQGGRLVAFRSRDLLHEVCSTHASAQRQAVRWALSIWILGRKSQVEARAADPLFVVG